MLSRPHIILLPPKTKLETTKPELI